MTAMNNGETEQHDAEPNEVDDGVDPEQEITPLRSGAHLERIAELEEERRFLLRSLEDL